jgi:hypothetical protein
VMKLFLIPISLLTKSFEQFDNTVISRSDLGYIHHMYSRGGTKLIMKLSGDTYYVRKRRLLSKNRGQAEGMGR